MSDSWQVAEKPLGLGFESTHEVVLAPGNPCTGAPKELETAQARWGEHRKSFGGYQLPIRALLED